MIGVDANILIYSHRRDSPFHDRARSVIARLVDSTAAWAIPWPCLHEFYAIVTHPRIYKPASTVDEAIRQVDEWLAVPTVHVLGESLAHWPRLRDRLESARIVAGAVHDARIAVICAEHGVTELWTADRDFSRYPDLKAVNPLVVAEGRR